MKNKMKIEDLKPCRPRLWPLFMCTAYVAPPDTPDAELIDEGDGTWMVVVFQPHPCPSGFEPLWHGSDDLKAWGKDFSNRDEAVKVYLRLVEELGLKAVR